MDYQQEAQYILVNTSPTAREREGPVEDARRDSLQRWAALGLTLETSFMSAEEEHFH